MPHTGHRSFRCLLPRRGQEGLWSRHADSGFGRKVPYLLGKASLASETRILAKALAPSIRVNAVAPGFVLPQAGEEELFAKQHEF